MFNFLAHIQQSESISLFLIREINKPLKSNVSGCFDGQPLIQGWGCSQLYASVFIEIVSVHSSIVSVLSLAGICFDLGRLVSLFD